MPRGYRQLQQRVRFPYLSLLFPLLKSLVLILKGLQLLLLQRMRNHYLYLCLVILDKLLFLEVLVQELNNFLCFLLIVSSLSLYNCEFSYISILCPDTSQIYYLHLYLITKILSFIQKHLFIIMSTFSLFCISIIHYYHNLL